MPAIVILDTNVLINLFHVGMINHLGALHNIECRITEEVNGELKRPEIRHALKTASEAGYIKDHPAVTDLETLAARADLMTIMQKGEAGSLAVAESLRCHIASDERKAFRPEAERRLGGGKVITTAGFLMTFIRHGIITVEEADKAKAVLEKNGYNMSFASFAEMCNDIGSTTSPD